MRKSKVKKEKKKFSSVGIYIRGKIQIGGIISEKSNCLLERRYNFKRRLLGEMINGNYYSDKITTK